MPETCCIIVGNTVTGLCTVMMGQIDKMCNMPMGATLQITAINGTHLTFLGTLSTTNMIMANWSKAMWQSVVIRAVRMLTSGPLGSHFFSSVATVGGN
ncbi:hypothetical protein KIN20_033996 [Parelaphostrongylus tenuis]|uniref:Uncharacterized protein n=1 Tax=Parelaphostrongylus tenuis TaxID=148309 RepID=A0AAD5R9F9_PARTN|nr:hypothetical protein KIN20_033996 [Parelaphostrongylus tenuis]